MPRVQVQDPTGVNRLSPSAQPVDTFARPFRLQPAEPNELLQLASALSDIQPGLNRWARRYDKAETDAQIRQAQADRLKNKLAFAEATEKGLIPSGANPHYVREYKRMDGELDAQGKYLGFLSERWQKSGLYEADFPTEQDAAEAYMGFVEETRGEFLTQTFGDGDVDPAWVEGFNARRSGIESSVGNHQVRERLTRNEAKFEANTSALIGELLDSDVEDYGSLIADLGRRQKAEYGVSHDKFNALVVEQVTANALNKAIEGDFEDAMNTLDALDEIPTSPGNVLGRTAAAKEARNAAALKITQLQQQRETYEWSKTSREWAMQDRPAAVAARNFQATSRERTIEQWERADKENRESDQRDLAYMDTMMEIVANPEQDFTATWEKLAEQPHTANLVPTLQAALSARINAGERVNEDEGQIAQLKLDVMRGDASPETIVQMVANRQLSYAHSVDILEDWSRVNASASTLADQRREVRSLVDDGRSGLRTAITGGAFDSSPVQNKLAFQAQLEYDDLMADFLVSNPQATLLEIRRHRAEVAKLLLDDPRYSPDAVSDFEAPFGVQTQGQQPAAPANPFDNPGMVE